VPNFADHNINVQNKMKDNENAIKMVFYAWKKQKDIEKRKMEEKYFQLKRALNKIKILNFLNSIHHFQLLAL
jgi:hypothetical protein